LFIACNKKNTSVNNNHSVEPAESVKESNIQLIHASPGTAGIKLWQDEKSLLPVGRYYKSNTCYFPIKSGNTKLELKDSKSDKLLSSISPDLIPGALYSLFVCDSPSRITTVLLPDNPLPVRSDKAQIRIVNVMSSGEPIDLLLNDNKIFNSVFYKGGSGYTYIDPGAFQCQIGNSNNGKALTPKFSYSFDSGVTYTIFANGFSFLTGAAGTDAIVIVNN
jgi:hypothetical protein